MATEETLLIKLEFDFDQPAASINDVKKRVKDLKVTLESLPKEGTPAFERLAQTISGQLGVSIEDARKKIVNFQKSATTEIQKGTEEVKEFNKSLKQSAPAANTIAALQARFKSLKKEVENTAIGTQEFADKSEELTKLRKRLREIRTESGALGPSLTNLTDALRKDFRGLGNAVKVAFGLQNIRAAIGTVKNFAKTVIKEFKGSNAAIARVDQDLNSLNDTVKQTAADFIAANQEGISKFLESVSKLIPILLDNADTILKVGAALTIYANRQAISNAASVAARIATAAYSGAMKLLSGQIRITTIAQKAFNKAAKANPIGLIITAVSALAFAFSELFKRSETFRNAVNGITDRLKAFFTENEQVQGVLKRVQESIGRIGNVLGGLIAVVGGAVAGLVELVVQSGALDLALAFVSAQITLFSNFIKGSIEAIQFIVKAISDYVESNKVLRDSFNFVGAAIKQFAELAQNIPALFNGIRSAVSQIGQNIKAEFQRIIIDAQILAQQIERVNPFGRTESEIDASINALRAKRAEVLAEQKGIVEAFKEGYDEVVDAQAKAAAEQARLAEEQRKRNAEVFANFKRQAQAAAGLTKEQEAVLRRNINSTRELTNAQKAELNKLIDTTKVAAKKAAAAFEDFSKGIGDLEKRIKLLIFRQQDYSKELAKLQERQEEVNRVNKEFAEATRFNETRLQALNREQQELNAQLKEAIANGQDYSNIQAELADKTAQLDEINKEFDAVLKSINATTEALVSGSMADYDARIKELQEQQKALNISSADYALLQQQINALNLERNRVTELLSFNTADAAEAQAKLNEQLSDTATEEQARARALERIRDVNSATEQGARQIAQIEADLARELEQIQINRKEQRLNQIEQELAEVEAQRQADLERFKDNELLKEAALKQSELRKTELLVEASTINSELLQKEVEDLKSANAAKEAADAQSIARRKELQQQLVQGATQAANQALELIQQVSSQNTQELIDQLSREKEAQLQRADDLGASEEAKERIRQKFDKKQEALEKKQAQREKAIAITQALIAQSLLVLKALASGPVVPNIVAGAIAATLGGIQIALIASRKFALGDVFDMQVQGRQGYYAKGAYLHNGAYHSQGGMPIINPYTGQKVAEIEKGEGIVNRRTMSSRQTVTATGTPYEIISRLNAMNGNGVRYPSRDKPAKITAAKPKFAMGGTFRVNSQIPKFQQGALVSADIDREATRLSNSVGINNTLAQIRDGIAILTESNKQVFGARPTVTEELVRVEQLKQDENNAS